MERISDLQKEVLYSVKMLYWREHYILYKKLCLAYFFNVTGY
jgi:hypothetical protein